MDMIYLLTGSAIAFVAFVVVLPGSIFQIFGVYNNCWSLTAVRTWTYATGQKWVHILGGSAMSSEYADSNASYATTMTWSTTVVFGILAYLGYWYQKALRRAVSVELDRL